MREEVIRFLKATPFQPFLIVMDSGDRVLIRHPENVAYDPGYEEGNCYAVADGIMHVLSWDKMTSVALADRGKPLPTPMR